MSRGPRVGLGGLAVLGLTLLSCRAAPALSRRAPTAPPPVARAVATPFRATPTAAINVGSARSAASATPGTSLIAIGSLATLVPGTAPAGPSAAVTPPAMVTPSPVSSPRPPASGTTAVAQVPGNAYAIAVPDGWHLNPVAGTGAIVIAPPGQQEPVIYIIPAVRVSDARYQAILSACNQRFAHNRLGAPDAITGCIEPAVRSQLADSRQPWSPQAAFPVILRLMSGAGAAFGPPRLTALSTAGARYIVAGTKNGRSFTDWGYLGMAYLPNPLLAGPSGAPGVTSLAFLSGCEAPTSQVASFRLVCDSVLRSFQPGQQWESNLAQQTMQGYRQEYETLLQIGESVVQGFGIRSAMISQFGATMQQMQVQTFQNIQAANLHTGQNWIAAFGPNVYAQDPTTGNQVLLGGSELVPGRYVGSPSNTCATLLRPQSGLSGRATRAGGVSRLTPPVTRRIVGWSRNKRFLERKEKPTMNAEEKLQVIAEQAAKAPHFLVRLYVDPDGTAREAGLGFTPVSAARAPRAGRGAYRMTKNCRLSNSISVSIVGLGAALRPGRGIPLGEHPDQGWRSVAWADFAELLGAPGEQTKLGGPGGRRFADRIVRAGERQGQLACPRHPTRQIVPVGGGDWGRPRQAPQGSDHHARQQAAIGTGASGGRLPSSAQTLPGPGTSSPIGRA